MPSRSPWLRIQFIVALVLTGSYAYFWHSRDWNSASRLMLTYAIVDRGTISLNGLDRQTGDIAYYRGRYYCDKLPGYSLLATIPYGICRGFLRFPSHPLHVQAMAYWPADYWVTLGTSGFATAFTALLLVELARRLGCSPRAAGLLGLAYGLATPAYVYATLAYGHQLSALALLGSLVLIEGCGRGRRSIRPLGAGFLAAYAAVIELQVGPVSAILGFYLVAMCAARRCRPDAIAYFGLGASIPTLGLLTYNQLAFGSPWDMGYFHHATAMFAQVHNRDNPLGLLSPDWSRAWPLVWGGHRGLLFYAPILVLAIPGWLALLRMRRIGLAVVSLAIVTSVFLVNLSYPEWSGGWSTGPRLLVTLLPFAMIPVAATLVDGGAGRRPAFILAMMGTVAGGGLILLFQGVGARLPQDILDPLRDVVWPLWIGRAALPRWWTGDRFARNLCSHAFAARLGNLPAEWQWIQFVPLVLFQILGGIAIATNRTRRAPEIGRETVLRPGSDLGIDQEKERRGSHQNAQNPQAEPHRVVPDPGP